MSPLDLGVLVVYVVGCTALGAWIGSGATGQRGYFLGESDIPAWAVMVSIVATETSAVTFLSVPGIAYRGDLTYLQLPLGYILARVFIAAVLLPWYFAGQIDTAYQVLRDRFGGLTQKAASVLFLSSRTVASGLRLGLAAKVLQLLTGWSMPATIAVVGLSTVAYTYLGGMKAVVWTDVIQFFVYLAAGAIALALLARLVPGGWAAIAGRAASAGKLRALNPSFDLGDPYTLWAGVIGGMVLDTGTHGADQMMVQRYLSARSERQAAGALVASGLVILAQFALFLAIGLGLYAFYQDRPPSAGLATDQEFAYFILHYLPTGVRGLVIAAVFSVTMSTLSGALSASASSTVNDLYRPLAPGASERHLLRVGKGLTAVWGAAMIGVALAALGLKDNVVNNALAVASFLSGILLGLFLLGLVSKRAGQGAALAGLGAGVAAVSYAKFGPLLGRPWYPFGVALAWPWYALVGSTTVVLVGLLAGARGPAAGRGAIR